MDCEFCKKTFSSKSNLISHQKSTKYCLELQGKTNNDFVCQYCSRTFTLYKTLSEHINVCKKKQIKEEEEKTNEYEKILKKLEKYEGIEKRLDDKNKENKQLKEKISDQKEYISKLEAKLEKFEDTVTSMVLCKTDKKATPNTTTTTNNTTNIVINNSLNLNDIPTMTAFLEEKMDKEVVAGGQKGLALLLKNTVLKDKYKCVDPSRQNFEFTNELGEVERDVKAKKLTNALIKSDICAKAGERGIQLWKKEDGSTDSLRHDAHSKKVLEMIMFSQDNSTFRSELSALTS